jgi:hypothetical protein
MRLGQGHALPPPPPQTKWQNPQAYKKKVKLNFNLPPITSHSFGNKISLVKVPKTTHSLSPKRGRKAAGIKRTLPKTKSANSTPTAQTLHMSAQTFNGETRRFELDEWMQGYRESTGEGMKSVVLHCQTQLAKADMFAEKLESPNELKTAIACDCLEQVSDLLCHS